MALKRFLHDSSYHYYRVGGMAMKAKRTVAALFDAMMDGIRVMPSAHQEWARAGERALGETGRARAIEDYIAEVTDRYAIAGYRRLHHRVELT